MNYFIRLGKFDIRKSSIRLASLVVAGWSSMPQGCAMSSYKLTESDNLKDSR